MGFGAGAAGEARALRPPEEEEAAAGEATTPLPGSGGGGGAPVQWARKFWHVAAGTAAAAGALAALHIFCVPAHTVRVVLALLALAEGTGEALCARSPALDRLFLRVAAHMLRPAEICAREHTRVRGSPFRFTSIFWYLAGAALACLLLPLEAGLLGILYLAWGDSAAAVVGSRASAGGAAPLWRFRNGKTLEGCAAAFAVSAAVTCVWTLLLPGPHLRARASCALPLAAAGGLGAAAGELLLPSLLGVDDNLIVPPVGACAVSLAAALLACELPFSAAGAGPCSAQ